MDWDAILGEATDHQHLLEGSLEDSLQLPQIRPKFWWQKGYVSDDNEFEIVSDRDGSFVTRGGRRRKPAASGSPDVLTDDDDIFAPPGKRKQPPSGGRASRPRAAGRRKETVERPAAPPLLTDDCRPPSKKARKTPGSKNAARDVQPPSCRASVDSLMSEVIVKASKPARPTKKQRPAQDLLVDSAAAVLNGAAAGGAGADPSVPPAAAAEKKKPSAGSRARRTDSSAASAGAAAVRGKKPAGSKTAAAPERAGGAARPEPAPRPAAAGRFDRGSLDSLASEAIVRPSAAAARKRQPAAGGRGADAALLAAGDAADVWVPEAGARARGASPAKKPRKPARKRAALIKDNESPGCWTYSDVVVSDVGPESATAVGKKKKPAAEGAAGDAGLPAARGFADGRVAEAPAKPATAVPKPAPGAAKRKRKPTTKAASATASEHGLSDWSFLESLASGAAADGRGRPTAAPAAEAAELADQTLVAAGAAAQKPKRRRGRQTLRVVDSDEDTPELLQGAGVGDARRRNPRRAAAVRRPLYEAPPDLSLSCGSESPDESSASDWTELLTPRARPAADRSRGGVPSTAGAAADATIVLSPPSPPSPPVPLAEPLSPQQPRPPSPPAPSPPPPPPPAEPAPRRPSPPPAPSEDDHVFLKPTAPAPARRRGARKPPAKAAAARPGLDSSVVARGVGARGAAAAGPAADLNASVLTRSARRRLGVDLEPPLDLDTSVVRSSVRKRTRAAVPDVVGSAVARRARERAATTAPELDSSVVARSGQKLPEAVAPAVDGGAVAGGARGRAGQARRPSPPARPESAGSSDSGLQSLEGSKPPTLAVVRPRRRCRSPKGRPTGAEAAPPLLQPQPEPEPEPEPCAAEPPPPSAENQLLPSPPPPPPPIPAPPPLSPPPPPPPPQQQQQQQQQVGEMQAAPVVAGAMPLGECPMVAGAMPLVLSRQGRQWQCEADGLAAGPPAASCRLYQSSMECFAVIRVPPKGGEKADAQLVHSIAHGYVFCGHGVLVANGSNHALQPETAFTIPPGTRYRIVNLGSEEMHISIYQRRLLPTEFTWQPIGMAP